MSVVNKESRELYKTTVLFQWQFGVTFLYPRVLLQIYLSTPTKYLNSTGTSSTYPTKMEPSTSTPFPLAYVKIYPDASLLVVFHDFEL